MSTWPCDEECSLSALNGEWTAIIDVMRRENPGLNEHGKRGCFSGTWTLKRKVKTTSIPIASGTIEGTVWAGTYDIDLKNPAAREKCEDCDAPCHFEGTMKARGRRSGLRAGTGQ